MESLTLIKNTHIADKACFRIRFAILLVIAGMFTVKHSMAQLNVSVNIVSQPLWGPANYDYVEYYYLPEADVFYYVPTSQFIYWNAGNWMFVPVLPAVYHVDLYRTYKVIVNEPKPYMNHPLYVKNYGKYKTFQSKQLVIRDSHDKKYYVVKGHPGSAKVNSAKPSSVKSSSVKPNSTKSSSVKPNSAKSESAKPNSSNGKGNKKERKNK